MEKIVIIDLGSQYTQQIAKKIRALHVYCEIVSCDSNITHTNDTKGYIISGSSYTYFEEHAPKFDFSCIPHTVPVLAISYGALLMAESYGATIQEHSMVDFVQKHLIVSENIDNLLPAHDTEIFVWTNSIPRISNSSNIKPLAQFENGQIALFKHADFAHYGCFFHPEIIKENNYSAIIEQFALILCGASQTWTAEQFVNTTIANIKKTVGNDKVVLGLSGGVDSSVAAVLLHRAIGDNLISIFVDHGLLRKHEYNSVLEQYKTIGLNVIGVDAKNLFLDKLEGVSDPETKRKIIGNTFIEVFDAEAHKLPDVNWLAQGTIYPDVIESFSAKGDKKLAVKSHHNVGGLPDFMKLKLVEPLRLLFKDEVREIGKYLEMPADILNRHPFPGPGLAIRLVGEITRERIAILQDCDAIFINELKAYNLYSKIWQAGAILLPVQSVGVKDGERTYESCVALRAVQSVDGMTAQWCDLPYEFLAHVSNKIIESVQGVNRVVYDISSKPPATIEWE